MSVMEVLRPPVSRPAPRARGRVIAACAVGLLWLGTDAALAATVTVRADPDATYDEVYYVAGPGEHNRLEVAYAGDARSVVVTDPGAVITAQSPCVSIHPHAARCTKRPAKDVEWLQSTRVDLGDGDDRLSTTRPGPAPIGGVNANGGPGNDRLDGGAGSDVLNGGGGRDELYGGAGFDVLTDGDRDARAGESAPAADLLDGGPERDTLSYAQRTAAVRGDIGDAEPDGAPGEGDLVRGFEDITGGAGDDRLDGDDQANSLVGGAGDDVLSSRGGHDDSGFGERLIGGPGADRLSGGEDADRLRGGPGRDRLSCGGGRDDVDGARRDELVPRSCERLHLGFGPARDRGALSLAPSSVSVGRQAMTFRLACPGFEADDGYVGPCGGEVILRDATAPRRLLGRARIAHRRRRGDFVVRVALTERGRRRVRARAGSRATLALILRGGFNGDRRIPRRGWTIQLPR